MVGWDALWKPAALTLWQMGKEAAKGGVPDQMPFNLTAKFAMRQAMENTLALANRINDRVGVQDITGSNAGSQPLYSPMAMANRIKKTKISFSAGDPGIGMNNG